VKKVSDIVAEIAAASREQSSGIDQVGRAVMQMDELTQQNAALVEEATAASQSLAGQSRDLNQLMERFNIGTAQASSRDARRAAQVESAAQPRTASAPSKTRPTGKHRTSARSVPPEISDVAAPAVVRKASGDDGEWQEF
jgi:methyl-accepting chemotaxis protein